MGALETKEELIPETPKSSHFESYSNMFAISDDPRSPDVSRTPILVQDPRYDPRSPATEAVDRTPIYPVTEPVSPYVNFKMDNPAYVDSPLSAANNKHVDVLDEQLQNKFEQLKFNSSMTPNECDKKKTENKFKQPLLRTVLFKQFQDDEFKSNAEDSEVPDITNKEIVNDLSRRGLQLRNNQNIPNTTQNSNLKKPHKISKTETSGIDKENIVY